MDLKFILSEQNPLVPDLGKITPVDKGTHQNVAFMPTQSGTAEVDAEVIKKLDKGFTSPCPVPRNIETINSSSSLRSLGEANQHFGEDADDHSTTEHRNWSIRDAALSLDLLRYQTNLDVTPMIEQTASAIHNGESLLRDEDWNATVLALIDLTKSMRDTLTQATSAIDNESLETAGDRNTIIECSSSPGSSPKSKMVSTATSTRKSSVSTGKSTPSLSPKRAPKRKSATRGSSRCLHCGTSDTPEWRKGPDGDRSVCNACGLFFSKLVKKFGRDKAVVHMTRRREEGRTDDRKVPDRVE